MIGGNRFTLTAAGRSILTCIAIGKLQAEASIRQLCTPVSQMRVPVGWGPHRLTALLIDDLPVKIGRLTRLKSALTNCGMQRGLLIMQCSVQQSVLAMMLALQLQRLGGCQSLGRPTDAQLLRPHTSLMPSPHAMTAFKQHTLVWAKFLAG
jgi:hypothetical protein